AFDLFSCLSLVYHDLIALGACFGWPTLDSRGAERQEPGSRRSLVLHRHFPAGLLLQYQLGSILLVCLYASDDRALRSSTHWRAERFQASEKQSSCEPLNTYHILMKHHLVAPVEATLRAVPGGMIALKRPAKCLIPLAVPDSLYRLLEDVPQHTLLLVLPGAPMPEGRKTTREHIPARSDVGQRVRTPTT